MTPKSSNQLPAFDQFNERDMMSDFASRPMKGRNRAAEPADSQSKSHLCTVCGRGFTSAGHLSRHQRIHTGVKAFRCPYPGCGAKTSRLDNLQQHYRRHLPPTLRRGDGSHMREAVNLALEAAGIKASSKTASRKSNGPHAEPTPSTAEAGSSNHSSQYQTPTLYHTSPFVSPIQGPDRHTYTGHPPRLPRLAMRSIHDQSAIASRLRSSVYSTGLVPVQSDHQQQSYVLPFVPYSRTGELQGQDYRHSSLQPDSYAPPPYLQFRAIYRQPASSNNVGEGPYPGVMTQGYSEPNPRARGQGYSLPTPLNYQSPISQSGNDHTDVSLPVYRAQGLQGWQESYLSYAPFESTRS